MKAEQYIRTAFGPADPARHTTIAPPPVTPAQLIARAETAVARSSRPLLPRRRLMLLSGAVVVATVTAYALPKGVTGGTHAPTGPDTTAIGQVLLPVAYQFDTNPQPAAAHLGALADRITATPNDGKTGRHTYRHDKSWGNAVLSHEGHELRYVEEHRRWTAPDGSGRSRLTTLAAEFTSEQSRRYWERELPKLGHPPIPYETTTDIPPDPPALPPALSADPTEAVRPADRTQPPTDPATLATLLRTKYGAADAYKWTRDLYQRYVVPQQVRRQVLLTLADLDGADSADLTPPRPVPARRCSRSWPMSRPRSRLCARHSASLRTPQQVDGSPTPAAVRHWMNFPRRIARLPPQSCDWSAKLAAVPPGGAPPRRRYHRRITFG